MNSIFPAYLYHNRGEKRYVCPGRFQLVDGLNGLEVFLDEETREATWNHIIFHGKKLRKKIDLGKVTLSSIESSDLRKFERYVRIGEVSSAEGLAIGFYYDALDHIRQQNRTSIEWPSDGINIKDGD